MSKNIEYPIVEIDDFYNKERVMIIHNYVNTKGKVVLNKEEAALLYCELRKFILSFKHK